MTLRFDPVDHRYFWNEKELPSNSNILDVREKVYEFFSRLPHEDRIFYMGRGRAYHAACHYDDKGTLNEGTVDPLIMPYLQAYRKAKKELRLHWIMREQPLFDSKIKVATTPDCIGEFSGIHKGEIGIVDLKPEWEYWWHPIQTAIQKLIVSAQKEFKNKILREFCLYLTNRGTYKIREHKDGRFLHRASSDIFNYHLSAEYKEPVPGFKLENGIYRRTDMQAEESMAVVSGE